GLHTRTSRHLQLSGRSALLRALRLRDLRGPRGSSRGLYPLLHAAEALSEHPPTTEVNHMFDASRTRHATLIVLLGVAGMVHAAALTPSQRTCQDAIATGGRKLLESATAILAECHRDVARAALPAGTSCVADPAISQARGAAAAKALRPVVERCTDADVTALS